MKQEARVRIWLLEQVETHARIVFTVVYAESCCCLQRGMPAKDSFHRYVRILFGVNIVRPSRPLLSVVCLLCLYFSPNGSTILSALVDVFGAKPQHGAVLELRVRQSCGLQKRNRGGI
jgi:hypothetical protein